MSAYEERKKNRIERYEYLASSNRIKAAQLADESWSMVKAIPLGQPLMPDHYSYKSDLNYRNKAHNKMGASVNAASKADYYEAKAEAARNNRQIDSDDPEAIVKLGAKIEKLEAEREAMKRANKIIRKIEDDEEAIKALISDGFDPKEARDVVTSPYLPNKRCYTFELTNLGARIRDAKKRVAALEKMETSSEPLYVKTDLWSMYTEDGRILIDFIDKPDEKIRKIVKSFGFKWAPSIKAWSRKLTPRAVNYIKYNGLVEKLKEITNQ